MSADEAARGAEVFRRLTAQGVGRNGVRLDDEPAPAEKTTWEPVDLTSFINGDYSDPQPAVGVTRTDGVRFIYPGREHAVVGETESGKTWLALACVAAELAGGNPVVYIHFEESNPASTVERLLALGTPAAALQTLLRFVAPSRPLHSEWLAPLLAYQPTLAVLDGVNEAMSLHGDDTFGVDGAAGFRRRVVSPFLRAGAATVACDHVTKNSDGRGRYAYGSAHKLNALDGAAFMVENEEPFGRGRRGRSSVFVVKDRPGQLRAHGQPSKGVAGKTFFGTLVVDDTNSGPDFVTLYAPTGEGGDHGRDDTSTAVADQVWGVIAAQPNSTVKSMRELRALAQKSGISVSYEKLKDAVADLLVHDPPRVVEARTQGTTALGYMACGVPGSVPTDEDKAVV